VDESGIFDASAEAPTVPAKSEYHSSVIECIDPGPSKQRGPPFPRSWQAIHPQRRAPPVRAPCTTFTLPGIPHAVSPPDAISPQNVSVLARTPSALALRQAGLVLGRSSSAIGRTDRHPPRAFRLEHPRTLIVCGPEVHRSHSAPKKNFSG
jgi:hypothetical protein